MNSLSNTINRITVKALDRKSARLAALLGSWEAIVGPRHAEISRPIKLARGGTANEDAPAILHLAVPPSWKTEFQHEAPQLIARINSFFGYRAVGEIKFSARTVENTAPVRQRRPVTHARSALNSAELDAKVSTIEDPALKAALLRLGQAIQSRGE